MEKVTWKPGLLTTRYYSGVYTNFAGIPEIVVRIGQVKYWSPYTLRDEWQLVTVAFALAKCCDLKLFELVEKLESLGLLKETLPGKVASRRKRYGKWEIGNRAMCNNRLFQIPGIRNVILESPQCHLRLT